MEANDSRKDCQNLQEAEEEKVRKCSALDEKINGINRELDRIVEDGGGVEHEYDYYMDELSTAVRQRAALW